jgi:hypothetical protein
MWNNVVGDHIRRSNRSLLFINTLLLIGLSAFALLSSRYLYNFFFGPFPGDGKLLLAQKDPQDGLQYFITIDSEHAISTGQTKIEQRTRHGRVESESVVAEYYLVPIENQFLMVEGPPGLLPAPGKAGHAVFTGTLTANPDHVALSTVSDVQKVLKGRITMLPFILQTNNFRVIGIIGLIICVPLYFVALWNVARGIQRWGRMDRHPIAQSLKRYGEPTEVAEGIDKQYQSDKRMKVGALTILSSWVLRRRMFGLDVFHASDLVWGYKKSTKHYTNGIPTGTTHAAVICTRQGEALEAPLGEQNVVVLLQALYERAPWMVVGYDKQVEYLWKSKRASLVAEVDNRMHQIMHAVEQAKQGPPE